MLVASAQSAKIATGAALAAATAGKTVANAVTEWWHCPLATYLDDPYPRILGGGVSEEGHGVIYEMNLVTKETKTVDFGMLRVDDHCPVAVHCEAGRRFVAIGHNHNLDNTMRVKVSPTDRNIASFKFAAEITSSASAEYSYAQIHKMGLPRLCLTPDL